MAFRIARLGLTGRTVLVRRGNVQGAFMDLNRIMKNTGIEAQVGKLNYTIFFYVSQVE